MFYPLKLDDDISQFCRLLEFEALCRLLHLAGQLLYHLIPVFLGAARYAVIDQALRIDAGILLRRSGSLTAPAGLSAGLACALGNDLKDIPYILLDGLGDYTVLFVELLLYLTSAVGIAYRIHH